MEKTRRVPLSSGSDESLPDDFQIGRRSPTHSRLASEIGAAIAHELNGPMTALLLYVGDIQQSCGRLADKSLKRVVDGAVLEAERICALVHRIGDSFEAPIPKDTAISVARDVITWWARTGQPDGKVAADAGDQAFNEFARSGAKPLTPREREVLRLVVEGCSNKEGAALMKISYRTFECHRAGVIRKLGAKNTAELVRLALLDTTLDSTPLEGARRVALSDDRICQMTAGKQYLAKGGIAEEMFRLAVEACPSGMMMIDHVGKILMVNTEIERQFAYVREELVGQPVDVLVPERLRTAHVRHRHSFARKPETRRMGAGRDLFGRRKDGTEFPVEVGLNPIHAGGRLLMLAVIVDIGVACDGQVRSSLRKGGTSLEDLAQKSFRSIGSHSASGRLGEAAMAAIRILYVDDEADIREVIEISLGLDPDFVTRSCESGPEGVKIAAEWDPDLILLDVMMPIMDGPATLSALRENPATADIPVIFMTARAQPRELDRFRSLGAAGVIAKPFDPMTLASSVRAYLQPAGDPLADLKVRFLRRVARDIVALAEQRSALKHGDPPPHSLERIRDIAHSLSGAGGIYGFPDISDAAADVEDAALALVEAPGSGERLSGALDRLVALAPSKEDPADDTAASGIRVST